MQFDSRSANPFARLASARGEPPSLLKKILAVLVTGGLFIVAMMFSVVLFAIVLTVGAIAWGYLWWKTRAVRKRMAAQQQQQRSGAGPQAYGGARPQSPGGLIIEGEVIREVRSEDGR